MAETTSAPTAQETKLGSDEWVEKTLNRANQAEAADGEPIESQGEQPDATAAQERASDAAATTWRDAVIPEDDPDVPERYRGKPASELLTRGYKELERTWNADREKMRQLEAKLAAKETLEEFLKEARANTPQQPPVPTDPFKEAGLDLETDSVLNPTKFFPKFQEMTVEQTRKVVSDEIAKVKQEQQRAEEQRRQYDIAQGGVAALLQGRGLDKLSQEERDRRIHFVLSESSRLNPQRSEKETPQEFEARVRSTFNPEALLKIHDSIWSPVPREAAAKPTPPDPPGAKRPAAIDSTKPSGPNLSAFEREQVREASAMLKRMGFDVNEERYAARFAGNLKRARG